MRIKDRNKYSERLLNDFMFIKRKMYKLSYLLGADKQILLQEYLVELEDLTYDLVERIKEDGYK